MLEYTQKFDSVSPDLLRVPTEELTAACENLDAGLRAALEETIRRCREVAENDRRSSATTTFSGGGSVTSRWLPVERVGLYVPGGLAVYPSTVIMNAVPAQAAGVDVVWAANTLAAAV